MNRESLGTYIKAVRRDDMLENKKEEMVLDKKTGLFKPEKIKNESKKMTKAREIAASGA